ncbi:hypothetical protein MFM001_30590 [Mycobacterium sp. MFM001]|uniref:hypothetical protein n=1 Tax=Mycobacterium sp. MFM001 TaxID=2049453 RepID=UPI000DA59D6C|nr:hypothetical protein [Mycobacterium sp. MFM001]GBE66597.1 hypothetical protein MFM001_30590 [Mycobacterium sp. MFM001]
MLWLAVLLVIVGAALAAFGVVLFTNGIGVAPHKRTAEDPTGVKRATSRLSWRDLFGRMPKSIGVITAENASRGDKLAAWGSLSVLLGLVAWCLAALALITWLV